MRQELLSVDNGKLKQDGSTVFDGLYLHLFNREIAGIICDDIQTKRRLNQFLVGEVTLDSGHLFIGEKKISTEDSARLFPKITVLINKKSELVDSLTVEENVFLFSDSAVFVNSKKYAIRFQALAEELDIHIATGQRPSELAAGERILVELMRAYVEKKRLVILDDVSGYLQRSEVETVFAVLTRLKQLNMTFLVGIGFEDEYLQKIGRITVMKNGRTISVIEPEKTDFQAYVRRLYFNEKTIRLSTKKKPGNLHRAYEQPALEFRHVSSSVLKDIDFSVGQGELLKIHCYDDRSCSRLIALLKGEDKPISGGIFCAGAPYRAENVFSAVHHGVCFLEECSYDTMLFGNMSVVENLGIPCGEKIRHFWMFRRYSESIVKQLGKKFGTITADTPVRNQKSNVLLQIAYYRWLLYYPKVIVCINPFTDVDIYMREKAIDMIHQYLERGIAVILVTSNYYTADKFEGKTFHISNGSQVGGHDDL